jgi:hypothetical protein
MIPIKTTQFRSAYAQLDQLFLNKAEVVHPHRWQGKDVKDCPDMRTHELLNVILNVELHNSGNVEQYRSRIGPNLPWADEHFEERVCGYPLNPPASYRRWPWATSAEKFVGEGVFNHTYPERLWPKYAGNLGPVETVEAAEKVRVDALTGEIEPDCLKSHQGIRHRYGDLNDLVALFLKDPLTRQGWVPLFFPEDTGWGDGGRKPCTLGYQFIVRDHRLHIYYPLRSCDYFRHFRDDIYLAIRLGLWLLNELKKSEQEPTEHKYFGWKDVTMGTYTMHCTSLHVFANDMQIIRERVEKVRV